MMEKEAMASNAGAAAVEQSSGVMGKVQDIIDVNDVVEKIKSSKDRIFEVGLYAGIGFLSGFLIKKYSSYVAACVLFAIGLGVLHHLGFITIAIQWDKVNALLGMQSVQTVSADSLISMAWEWAKVNMVISISYIIGLFLGLKVG